MQRPYTPAEHAPAPVDNPDVAALFRQGVHDAARAWFQELPTDLQQRLPQDPFQAFRHVLDNPSVVPALYRYDMIQSANRIATAWYSGVPTGARQLLPPQPMEAFESAVLRLQAKQRAPAAAAPPDTMTTTSTAAGGPIAQRVLQEQQESLPPGIQAGPPHYGLPPLAPRLPPAPQEVVPYVGADYPLNTAESFEASRQAGVQWLKDFKRRS